MSKEGPKGSEGDSESAIQVDSLMRAGAPVESLEERMALHAVESRLFGRPRDPVRFARYVLLDRLGEGAAGLVYEAYDPTLDRAVAIKLMQSRGQAASQGAQRLLSEAQALARLSHANVVAIYDARAYDESDLEPLVAGAHSEVPRSGVFIVMERLRGVSMREWAAPRPEAGGPTLEERGRVLAGAARGLMAAHAAGLVHRDFKPDNVVVVEEGQAKVVDFGLAAPTGEDSNVTMRLVGDAEASDSGLAVVGTPAYMAPEQHVGQGADARSDQFAFACTAFEVLTGERPFVGRTPRALALEKSEGKLRWPSGHDLPRSTVALLERALDPDPKKRLPSLVPLVEALDPKPRRRQLGVLVGAIGLGLALAAYASLPNERADCLRDRARADDLWSEARAADVRASFAATGLDYQATSGAAVERAMASWVQDWRVARTEVCERLGGEGEAPRIQIEAELACLDRRLAGAKAVAAMLAAADESVVEHGPTMVRELETPGSCVRSAQTVTLTAMDEADASVLARARALRLAGKYADARLRLAEVEAMVERSAIVAAHVHAERAAIDLSEGHLHEAEANYLEAIVAGERASDAELVSHAWTQLAWVVGVEMNRVEAGRTYIRIAEASLADLPESQGRLAELDHTKGGLAYASMQHEDARAHYARALERLLAAYGEEHPSVARTHSHIANVLINQKRFPEAREHAERSLELRRRVFGDRHPVLAGSYNNLAVIVWRMGEPELTFEYLEASRSVTASTRSQGLGIALKLSAEFSRDLGRIEDAERYRAEYEAWAAAHGGTR